MWDVRRIGLFPFWEAKENTNQMTGLKVDILLEGKVITSHISSFNLIIPNYIDYLVNFDWTTSTNSAKSLIDKISNIHMLQITSVIIHI